MKKWLSLLLCISVCCQSAPVFAQDLLLLPEEEQEAAVLQVVPENLSDTEEELHIQPELPEPEQEAGTVSSEDAENASTNLFTDGEGESSSSELPDIQALTEELLAESSDEFTLKFEAIASEAYGEAQAGSFNKEYRDQLSGNALALYDGMLSALKDSNPGSFIVRLATPLSGTTGYRVVNGNIELNEDLSNIYFNQIRPDCISAQSAFFYDHPEIFWVNKLEYRSDQDCYTFTSDSASQTATFTLHSIKFTISEEAWTGASSEIPTFNSSVSSVKNTIQASFTSSMTVAEKARVIHDYICNHVDYDYNALTTTDPQAHSAYGFFCGSGDARVVCEGYSKAYKILCDDLGIPCVLGVGQAVNSSGASESHMWNYVKVDGSWYLVDVTWDDQESQIYTIYFLAGSSTEGFSGVTVGNERTLSRYFMDTEEGVAFVQPAIAVNAYTAGVSPSPTDTATPTPALIDTPTPVPITTVTPTPLPTEPPSRTIKNAVYILSEDNTAVYMNPVKKKKTIQIPAVIKVNGKKYTVTAIAAAAFKKDKTIKTITIGKNVTVIGKGAFQNAKNLKLMTIKSKKLVSIESKAFKGTSKSLVIKVPKKKYSKYKTLLSKAGFKGKLVKY